MVVCVQDGNFPFSQQTTLLGSINLGSRREDRRKKTEENVLSFAPFRVPASLVGQQSNLFPYPLLDNLSGMHKRTWFIKPLRHNFTELRKAYPALASTPWAAHTSILKGEQYGVKWRGFIPWSINTASFHAYNLSRQGQCKSQSIYLQYGIKDQYRKWLYIIVVCSICILFGWLNISLTTGT